MRRKTLLTTVIIAVALVGCNKAGAGASPTTEANYTEELASTSIEETTGASTEAPTTTIAPTEPTIMKETTSTKEEVTTIETSYIETEAPTTIKEEVTSTKEVASTKAETTTVVAPTETSGEGIIEAETTSVANTKEPEETTTVTSATTVAPTTTEAPATTVAPTTTEAPHSHSYTSTVTKASTCTEDGIMTFICSCGDTYTEAIGKIAHSYGEYTYNNDATTENDGTKTATCAVCGATDTITAEGTKITEHTHQYDSYSEGNYGRATCTVCGKTAWVHLPLPTEHCPYTLNTKIYNDDGTISFYYVDSNATDEKYGYNDGGAGNRAANDFDSWCEGNYYDRIGDDRVGDYAEGVVCELTAKPY